MYCFSCGKEISDNAIMCPNCGAGTSAQKDACNQKDDKPSDADRQGGAHIKGLAVISVMLASIAFVTGIFSGIVFLAEARLAVILVYIIDVIAIMPALAGLLMGVYALICKKDADKTVAPLSVVAIALSAFVLVFLAAVMLITML